MMVEDGICHEAPSPQTEIDLFKGMWFYELPFGGTVSGQAKDFFARHYTVFLSEQVFGPISGWSCLELGPFEGVVSYSLHHVGAQVTAIEGRRRNFLKCLIAKNLLDMFRVRFLLGDFMKYLEAPGPQFDLGVATGVLYHMPEPLKLIELLAQRCRRIVIGTNYVGPSLFEGSHLVDRSLLPPTYWNISNPEGEPFEYKGLTVRQYKLVYPFDPEIHRNLGAGGYESFANMLTLDDILRAVDHFGFRVVGEVVDQPDGDRGPAAYFCAERKPGFIRAKLAPMRRAC